MCGIVGILAQSSVASELYDSLIHLQHRGQDAAGIITYDFRMHKEKGLGLVRDIFNENNMNLLTGNVGIGHTRYPTHGGFGHGEIQPFWTEIPYGVALGHNGNLVNYKNWLKRLQIERNGTSTLPATLRFCSTCLLPRWDKTGQHNQTKHSLNKSVVL